MLQATSELSKEASRSLRFRELPSLRTDGSLRLPPAPEPEPGAEAAAAAAAAAAIEAAAGRWSPVPPAVLPVLMLLVALMVLPLRETGRRSTGRAIDAPDDLRRRTNVNERPGLT